MREEQQKSLELLNKFFKENPSDFINEKIQEIDKLDVEGPSVSEYFEILEDQLVFPELEEVNSKERVTSDWIKFNPVLPDYFKKTEEVFKNKFFFVRIDENQLQQSIYTTEYRVDYQNEETDIQLINAA